MDHLLLGKSFWIITIPRSNPARSQLS